MLVSMPSSESGLLPVKAERILLLLWRCLRELTCAPVRTEALCLATHRSGGGTELDRGPGYPGPAAVERLLVQLESQKNLSESLRGSAAGHIPLSPNRERSS